MLIHRENLYDDSRLILFSIMPFYESELAFNRRWGGFNGVKREQILIPRAAIREGFEGARSLSHPSENISESTISYDLMFNWQDRIILDPKILAGKPVIKGTRLAVEFVIDLLANGWTETEILKNYPRLSHEDISACFSYANYSIRSS